MAIPALKLTEVSKSYGAIAAVKNVSFSVNQGEVFGLLGPNGAGKTTLLRMIVDIIKPDYGTVEFFGRSLDDDEKRRLGYLPEERGLYVQQKVLPMLEYFGCLKGLDRKPSRRSALDWLRRFNMEHVKDRKVKELSKGNQQKIQIITSLLSDPEVLILDEPFSGLDPVNTRELSDMIRELSTTGKTILLSTHRMTSVETLCQRVLMINKGEVVLYGDLDEIMKEDRDDIVYIDSTADFRQCELITHFEKVADGGTKVYLRKGVTLKDLQFWLLHGGAEVNAFERYAMSLEDIFIKLAKGKNSEMSNQSAESDSLLAQEI